MPLSPVEFEEGVRSYWSEMGSRSEEVQQREQDFLALPHRYGSRQTPHFERSELTEATSRTPNSAVSERLSDPPQVVNPGHRVALIWRCGQLANTSSTLARLDPIASRSCDPRAALC